MRLLIWDYLNLAFSKKKTEKNILLSHVPKVPKCNLDI
jgi:hypothetical protein